MSKVKNVTEIALFAALLGITSQLSIPLPAGIPLTVQTFAVALCALLLGSKKGTAATAVWLICGGIGAPFFSGFRGGIGVLFGPTGGFLLGFLPLCALCGRRSNASFPSFALRSAAGLLICHLYGILWFSFTAKITLFAAFLSGSLPYLIKDFLCLYAAKLCFNTLRKKIPSIS